MRTDFGTAARLSKVAASSWSMPGRDHDVVEDRDGFVDTLWRTHDPGGEMNLDGMIDMTGDLWRHPATVRVDTGLGGRSRRH